MHKNCYVGLILAVALPSASMSQVPSHFTPARFLDEPTPFEQLIEFPSGDEPIHLVLLCAAQISWSGKVELNACFAKNKDQLDFEKAIKNAVKKVNVSAALVNGDSKTVWLPYSVTFKRRGSETLVSVAANYGAEQTRYGDTYSAPQRILEVKREEGFNVTRCRRGYSTWAKAQISAEGKPQEVVVLKEVGRSCTLNLQKIVGESEFIPAHHQGNPVPAIFVEPFFDGRS